MAHSKQAGTRGDIAVFIMLIMVGLLVSSAVLFNTVLGQQLAAARDVEIIERAFYAADTALEQVLYQEVKGGEHDVTIDDGSLEYDDTADATYRGTGSRVTVSGEEKICAVVAGTVRGETRRLARGPTECNN